MSNDRVKFFLTDNDDNRAGDIDAARRAFNTHCYVWHKTIVCRPSQFARFLIYRSELVTNNRLKQFGAELISESTNILDVSNN